jgi:hypothetical protein
MSLPIEVSRALLVTAGLAAWFWTQRLIARRAFPEGRIGDRLLDLTAPLNRRLHEHPRRADALLAATSRRHRQARDFPRRARDPRTHDPAVPRSRAPLRALRRSARGSVPCPRPRARSGGIPASRPARDLRDEQRLFFSEATPRSPCTAASRLARRRRDPGGGDPRDRSRPRRGGRGDRPARALHDGRLRPGAVTALWVWTVANALAPGLDRWMSQSGLLG